MNDSNLGNAKALHQSFLRESPPNTPYSLLVNEVVVSIFSISNPTWNMIQFDSYFSNGLQPPTSTSFYPPLLMLYEAMYKMP